MAEVKATSPLLSRLLCFLCSVCQCSRQRRFTLFAASDLSCIHLSVIFCIVALTLPTDWLLLASNREKRKVCGGAPRCRRSIVPQHQQNVGGLSASVGSRWSYSIRAKIPALYIEAVSIEPQPWETMEFCLNFSFPHHFQRKDGQYLSDNRQADRGRDW